MAATDSLTDGLEVKQRSMIMFWKKLLQCSVEHGQALRHFSQIIPAVTVPSPMASSLPAGRQNIQMSNRLCQNMYLNSEQHSFSTLARLVTRVQNNTCPRCGKKRQSQSSYALLKSARELNRSFCRGNNSSLFTSCKVPNTDNSLQSASLVNLNVKFMHLTTSPLGRQDVVHFHSDGALLSKKRRWPRWSSLFMRNHPADIGSTKRVIPPRKFREKLKMETRLEHEKKKEAGSDVVAYSVADGILLEQLELDLEQFSIFTTSTLSPVLKKEVLYIKEKSEPAVLTDMSPTESDKKSGAFIFKRKPEKSGSKQPSEAFVFVDGTVVCWNMEKKMRSELLEILREKYSDNAHGSELVQHEMEYFTIRKSGNLNMKTDIVDDRIQLRQKEEEEGQLLLEKYTISNSLSQSVNLGIWEHEFKQISEKIGPLTKDLRSGRKVNMKKREVIQQLGHVFGLRHNLNLKAELLDTPDFYWEHEKLEPLYKKVCTHLNIRQRSRLMNEKLNYCSQILELFNSQLSDRKHVHLEWYIIILIAVELGIQIIYGIIGILNYLEEQKEQNYHEESTPAP